ncbi:MAG: uncharacterized protein PWQ96_1221 [Clostridia bacterium]|jgi:hypothetical protein|nr:polymerase beta domain protein region [Clostridiales bacterium]MDK2985579.1 uncharacterized protein [Clostridia bacterium]
MDKELILDKLSQSMPYLQQCFNVKRIGFFGSYARGENKPDSDIDILIEFFEPIGWEFVELKDYLEKLFGKNVDLVTENALKPQLKKRILNEVIYQ